MSFQIGDKVRIAADPMRPDGRYVGRSGRVASNTLNGIVWVNLGLHLANFDADELEAAE